MKKNLTIPLFNWDKGKRKLFFMRLGLLKLMLIFGLLSTHAHVNSQTVISKLKLEEVELSEALERIEELSSYDFVFNYNDLKGYKVSVDLEETSLEDCLDQVLKDVPFEYKTKGDVVVISYKEKVEPTQEQKKKEIKGTVTDTDGNTLPGVSVVVKGTTTGVATDIDGNYSIVFEKENAVLLFSFVGMIPQEIVYSGQLSINVELQADSEQMAEVVVTGYQTLSKERVTGSFQVVKSEELEKVTSSDLAQVLEGKVSGMVMNEDGELLIRGQSTMFANSQPLVVVDGFPIDGDLSVLNPKDIASVSVLKDAAAASIWGVRAANGVIVVTTKKSQAKEGKITVDFSSSLTVGERPDLEHLDWANSEQIVDWELESIEMQGVKSYWRSEYDVSAVEKIMLDKQYGRITEEEADAGLAQLRGQDNFGQVKKHLFRPSVTQQYNLAISAANKNMRNYLSVSHLNDKSYYRGNDNQRLTVNLKNDLDINKWLTGFVNFNTTFRNNAYNSKGSTYVNGDIRSYEMLLDENGDYPHMYKLETPYNKEKYEALGYKDWAYNVLQEQRLSDNTSKHIDNRIQTGLKIKLLEGIDLETKFQYEFGNSEYRNLQAKESYEARRHFNLYTTYDPVAGLTYNFPEGGILDLNQTKYYGVTLRTQLNINRKIGHNGDLIAVMGGEKRKYYSETNYDRKVGYDPKSGTSIMMNFEDFFNRKVGTFNPRRTYGYSSHPRELRYTDNRDVSFFANLGYTHKEKYGFTLSGRLDQSNLFGTDPKYRYNPLWSAGASWIVSKEDFFENDVVNYLKFRTTFGYNGNVDRTTSPYLVARYSLKSNPTEKVLRIDTSNPPNKKLRPERTAMVNLGMDMGLFNNRIFATLEYYYKRSFDLLALTEIDETLGFNFIKINAGEMENRGINLDIQAKVIDKAFKWNVGINVSRNENEVLESYIPSSYNAWLGGYPKPGYSIGGIFSFNWVGLDENGVPVVRKANGDEVAATAPLNDRIKDGTELVYSGDRDPKYYGGLTNTFMYKNFTLSFDFVYKFGNKMRMPVPTMNYQYATRMNQHCDISKRWRNPGDEETTNIPKLTRNYYVGQYYQKASINVDDASYVRLRFATLKYSLPKSLLSKTPLTRCDLQFQARNLALWAANKKGYDPDYVRFGGKLALPEPASYTLGLNVTF